jgi:hypothetical protein
MGIITQTLRSHLEALKASDEAVRQAADAYFLALDEALASLKEAEEAEER